MDQSRTARSLQVTTINGTWDLTHRGSNADLGVIQQIFGDQDYAFTQFKHAEPMRQFDALAQTHGRPLIVDCGANIGASPLYFSVLFPAATIVAIEPEADNFDLLATNIGHLPNVSGLNKAVASTACTVVLRDPGEGEWGYRAGIGLTEGRALGNVEAVPVDEVVAGVPNAVPLLLKVDIEGAEGDLFSRNTAAISDFPLVIVELHDWLLPGRGTSEPFLRWHLAEQRDLVQSGENVFSFARWLWDPHELERMARRTHGP